MVALVPDFVFLIMGLASALSYERVWPSAKTKMVVLLESFSVVRVGEAFPRVLWMPFVIPILFWKLPTLRVSKAMLVVLLRTCPVGMFGP